MDLVVYDDRDQRYVPMPVALAAPPLGALVVGGLVFVLARPGAPAAPAAAPAVPATTTAPATPSAPADPVVPSTTAPVAPAAPPLGVSTPQAGARDDAGCAPALERATAALALASRVETALQEQTSVMDDLLAERLTREQVLDRSLPSLTVAAKDRQAFLAAVGAYEQARAAC